MYKLIQDPLTNKVDVASTDIMSFTFVPDNTDYQAFKLSLQTDSSVQLQDANGNIMTSDQIATFVATLPRSEEHTSELQSH